MQIVVRPAGNEDAECVVAMSRAPSADEEQETTAFDVVDFCRHGCGTDRLFDPIVAERGSRAIGYAFSVRSYDTQLAAPVREIIDLYVDPDYRRQGIGRSLIEAIAEQARINGERAMIVRVWSENVAAHRFYEACGAREDRVRVFYWDELRLA